VNYAVIIQAILPVYLLVGVGLALRAFKVVTTEMEKGMIKLVIHCLYPCLILDKTLGNDLVQKVDVIAWGIGVGFGLVLIGMGISYLVALSLGLKPGTGRRTFCVSVGVQNYGYIAKLLINGPTVALVMGVFLSATGAWQFLDASGGGVLGGSVRQAMSWLGVCAFPMGLVLIGATMYDLIGKERLSHKITLGSLLVRLGVMPLIILAAAKWLPLIPELRQVLVVQAAMPAAVSPILVARHYGGSPGVAVQAVIVTSLVALVTMPLWIFWGIRLVFG